MAQVLLPLLLTILPVLSSSEVAARVRSNLLRSVAPDGPNRGDADAILRELAEGQGVYGLRENAAALADRRILLLGGWRDRQVTIDDLLLPLYRTLETEGARDVTFLTYDAGHAFSGVRDRLADDIAAWITGPDPAAPEAVRLPGTEVRHLRSDGIGRAWSRGSR